MTRWRGRIGADDLELLLAETLSVALRTQAVTPQALLGRVSALFSTVGFGARPVGAGLGGLVGETMGLDWAIALSTALFAVQAVIVLLSSIPRLRRLPETAAMP